MLQKLPADSQMRSVQLVSCNCSSVTPDQQNKCLHKNWAGSTLLTNRMIGHWRMYSKQLKTAQVYAVCCKIVQFDLKLQWASLWPETIPHDDFPIRATFKAKNFFILGSDCFPFKGRYLSVKEAKSFLKSLWSPFEYTHLRENLTFSRVVTIWKGSQIQCSFILTLKTPMTKIVVCFVVCW